MSHPAKLDYSKWDALASAEDAEEKASKEAERQKNRDRYFQEQEEKKKKFLEEQKKKKREMKEKQRQEQMKEVGHEHEHQHEEKENGTPHHHHHQHREHGPNCNHHPETPSASPTTTPASTSTTEDDEIDESEFLPRCGCGWADSKSLEKLKARAEKQAAGQVKDIPLPEKNAKKMRAVEATREHGKILFSEGKYAEAFAVYERGVLIINGMFGLSDADQETVTKLEGLLDVNMAACKLKLKEFKAAIENCQMALNLDAANVKAFYRMGSAYEAMGEFDDALEKYVKARALEPKNDEILKAMQRCEDGKKAQRLKEIQFQKEMAERIARHRTAAATATATATAAAEEEEGKKKTAACGSCEKPEECGACDRPKAAAATAAARNGGACCSPAAFSASVSAPKAAPVESKSVTNAASAKANDEDWLGGYAS